MNCSFEWRCTYCSCYNFNSLCAKNRKVGFSSQFRSCVIVLREYVNFYIYSIFCAFKSKLFSCTQALVWTLFLRKILDNMNTVVILMNQKIGFFGARLSIYKVILKLLNPAAARSVRKFLDYLLMIIVHKNFFFMCSCARDSIFCMHLCTWAVKIWAFCTKILSVVVNCITVLFLDCQLYFNP